MRTLTNLIASIVALSLLTAPAGAQQTRSGSAEDAMKLARELAESYVAAHNAHDVAKLATMFAADADWVSFLGGEIGMRLEGRAAIEQSYRESFAKSPQIQVEITPEHARLVTPDVIVGDYTWSLTNSTRTDRPSQGRATVVDHRRDGRWQIYCARFFMTPPTSAGSGARQTASRSADEAMKLAREGAESYVAAHDTRDVARLAARYAPDADWISFLGDQVGTRLQGRPAIEQYHREAFAKSPQIQAQVTPECARLVTPDLLVTDYTWSLTNSTRTDRPHRGRGTTVAVRRDGQWQDCCVRIAMAPASSAGQ